jgi:hypothetical protein
LAWFAGGIVLDARLTPTVYPVFRYAKQDDAGCRRPRLEQARGRLDPRRDRLHDVYNTPWWAQFELLKAAEYLKTLCPDD